jgi:hypothetical protein
MAAIVIVMILIAEFLVRGVGSCIVFPYLSSGVGPGDREMLIAVSDDLDRRRRAGDGVILGIARADCKQRGP